MLLTWSAYGAALRLVAFARTTNKRTILCLGCQSDQCREAARSRSEIKDGLLSPHDAVKRGLMRSGSKFKARKFHGKKQQQRIGASMTLRQQIRGPKDMDEEQQMQEAVEQDLAPPEVDLHGTTDASVWASEFCKRWPTALCQIKGREGVETEEDFEGIMIGWFANAIMAGVDSEARKHAEVMATQKPDT